MRFDNLEETAKVIFKLNNAALNRSGYTDVEMVASHMQGFAYQLEREGHTSRSTFGYQLTLFKSSALPLGAKEKETVCVVSVTTHMIKTFLNSMSV